jgi:GNAT superfamily N-acetyltransferase
VRPWYSVDRVNLDAEVIAELDHLDALTFPEDDVYTKDGRGLYWWTVTKHDHVHRRVVGFCGSLYWPPDNCVFLCRAGVLPEARGQGLQRRMIRVRVAHAASVGAEGCYTYTTKDNITSANNLIRCGFELYEPMYPWGCANSIYFWRQIQDSKC